jgi:hypothetical protein
MDVSDDGLVHGCCEDSGEDGFSLGTMDGMEDGYSLDAVDGMEDGFVVIRMEKVSVGVADGSSVGMTVGSSVGVIVGE